VPENPVITQKLEEITGYHVDINWIPATAYEDKFNTMLASDSLTNIVVPWILTRPSYLNAVDDGLFWELEKLIPDYPNLVKIGEARYNNVKRNGHIMAIPRSRDLVRQGMNYRQDWAEKLGITTQPKTTADIDKLVRGFAARPETKYGLVMGCSQINPAIPEGVDYLGVYMGAPINWGFNKQGQFTHAWLTDEYTQAVEQFRTWYADGLINKNFIEITAEDAKKILNTEEAGFVFLYADNIEDRFRDLYVKNPGAKLWYALEIDGRTFGTGGFNTAFAVSKTATKDETMLRHCLTFINNLAKPEWQAIVRNGLEGDDYSLAGGYATRNEKQQAHYTSYAGQYNQINVFGAIEPNPVPLKMEPASAALMAERLKYVDTCVTDPSLPFISETLTQIGVSELDPIRCDAINKYIMGVINTSAYQAAQQHWLQAGGAQVIKELADQINANR
jgi:putative aldouronate transport system substrate-binding protein